MSLSLHTLPVEMIYRILDHLKEEQLFLAMSNVSQRFNAILDSYPRYYTLTILELYKRNIRVDDVRSLCDILKYNNTRLEELTLAMSETRSEDLQYLFDTLQYNSTLLKLHLKSIPIGVNEVRHLAEALKHNTTLIRLCLFETGTKDALIECLPPRYKKSNLFEDPNDLFLLNLHTLNEESLNFLWKNCKQYSASLTEFEVVNTRIGDAVAQYIGEILKYNTTLTLLVLSENLIGDDGVRYISEGLKYNNTLTYFYFGSNEFGVRGVEYLSEGLKQNKTLTTLVLERNRITSQGAQYLGDLLKQNSTLNYLDLEGNHIEDEGVRYLSEALEQNATLTKLHISCNQIGLKGVLCMSKALEQNMTLTELSMGDGTAETRDLEKYFNEVQKTRPNLKILF